MMYSMHMKSRITELKIILKSLSNHLWYLEKICQKDFQKLPGMVYIANKQQCRKERYIMVKLALFVLLEAKPGKEADVENFLRGGLSVVQEEPATIAWFAIRLGPSTFGIFDAFLDESGRQAHLYGRVAAALTEKASELFAKPPSIEKVDVLAAKLPR